MKKEFIVLSLVIFITLFHVNNCFAGQFIENENGKYYVKDDGQLAKSEWIVMMAMEMV